VSASRAAFYIHRDSTEALDSGQGWQAGLNRPGTIGFMGEFNVLAKKSNSAAGESTL
jgi:hypothetical protein